MVLGGEGVRGCLTQARSCPELRHSRASISHTWPLDQPISVSGPQLRVSPSQGPRKPHPN